MNIYKVVVGVIRTNCYIVASKKNRAFIIDPGDNADKIKRVISKNGLKAEFIVNTHAHIDHIKADAALGLPVYIHGLEKEPLSDPEQNLTASFLGSFVPVIPSRLLKDNDKIELDELEFTVIHTPGHTQGGICLYSNKILFSGDTLFLGGVGRTDFPGASFELLLNSLKKLSKLPSDTKVYPGHGSETNIEKELGGKNG